MLASPKVVLSTCVLSSWSILASASSCNGLGGQIASDLVGDPIAESICSSSFPQPVQTVTLAPTASVDTSTVYITIAGPAASTT